MQINHVIFSIPNGDLENPEYLVLAAVFEEEDWVELKVGRDAWEYDELFLGKNEFDNTRHKWQDIILLKEFYRENARHFNQKFWKGLTINRFVEDVRASVPDIFEDFRKSCEAKGLYDHFEPLDKKDEKIREKNEQNNKPHKLVRLKSKYGYIINKMVFRLYAVEIDRECFIITGGAIKVEEKMEQAGNTLLELDKIDYVKEILEDVGITSKKAFLDYLKKGSK